MKRSLLNWTLDVGRWALGVFFSLSLFAGTETLSRDPSLGGLLNNTGPVKTRLHQLLLSDGAAVDTQLSTLSSQLDSKQPLDSDLTAIAGVSTTTFGRNALAIVDGPAFRTYIGAGTSNFDSTFGSLSGKPTTIAGYGITDFNSLGDARWQPLGSYEAPLTFSAPLSRSLNAISIVPATGSVPGSMSAADKAKLDAITGTNTGDQIITLTGDVTGFGTGSFATAIGTGKVTNTMLAGSIAYSKLTLTGAILNADLAGSIAYSKLSLTNSIVSGDIVSLTWSKLTGTPTTISGYGITDFNSLGDARWQPLDPDLTIYAGITPSANAQIILGHTFSQIRTDLGLVIGTNVQAWDADLDTYAANTPTTTGLNLVKLANPGAITFIKIAADNSVSTESAGTHRTSLGATTAGGNLFTLANPGAITFLQLNADNTVTAQSASAQRTALSLVIGTNVQAWDADLDTYATLPPSANAQTILGHTFSQMRSDLSLVIGTNVQAWDADLDTYAANTPTTTGLNLVKLANPGAITFIKIAADNSVSTRTAAQFKTDLSLTIGTDIQAFDADLDTYAANTPTTTGLNLVKLANPGAITFIKIAADNTVSTRTAAQFIGDLDTDLTTWAGITPSAAVQTMLGSFTTSNVNSATTDDDFVTITGSQTITNKSIGATQLTGTIDKARLPTVIGASAYHNAAQSISNTTSTAIALNSERWDTDTIHDTVTNNSRLTCKTAGKYLITASGEWASNATGSRELWIQHSTAGILADSGVQAGASTGAMVQSVSRVYDMAVNDYVQVFVWQSSGGGLNLNSTTAYSPEITMVWLGP